MIIRVCSDLLKPVRTMKLFCFASKNEKNIQLGIENRSWAVATLLNQQSMAGRRTKAQRYLRPGDLGLFYCNVTHCFTTPFIISSTADIDRVELDIWPEPWCLPFSIEPMGDLTKQISGELAGQCWSVARRRLQANHGRGGISAAMNITGTTVFVPVEVSQDEWEEICGDLCDESYLASATRPVMRTS